MDAIKRADKIRSELFLRGLTFADIERAYSLPPRSAYLATREPNPEGEAGLATALGREPWELFPERYDESGQRLSPQPRENYVRPPSMRQRRKMRAA